MFSSSYDNQLGVYFGAIYTHLNDDPNEEEYFTGGRLSDVVYGHAGRDIIDGNGGHDKLYGGAGADVLLGWDGDDQLYGGAGNDFLNGENGNDAIYGGSGDDHMEGGNGNDFMVGGSGNDFMVAGRGRDHLVGGSGNDNLSGYHGKNILDGGEGDDYLSAGSGSVLIGGTGDDSMFIQGNNNTLVFSNGPGVNSHGNDVIGGFQRNPLSPAFEHDGNKIDLSDTGVRGFEDLRTGLWSEYRLQNDIFMEQVGDDTIIWTSEKSKTGQQDSITLLDVDMNTLSSDDFIF